MQRLQLVVFVSVLAVGCCWSQAPTTCYVRHPPPSGPEPLTAAVNNLQQTLSVIADRLEDLVAQSSCPQPTNQPTTAEPSAMPTSAQPTTQLPTTELPTTEMPTTEMPTTVTPPAPSHGCPGDGWRLVKFLNMSDVTQDCPSGFGLTNYSEINRTCGRVNEAGYTCDSTFISTDGGQYSQVCGRVTAYRCGIAAAFSGSTVGQDLEGAYLDGISVTHGTPRTHVWSFASGFFAAVGGGQQQTISNFRCPCDYDSTATSPSFVGDNYFCDSVVNEATAFTLSGFYPDNALWDGVDSLNSCFDEPGVPWFLRSLPNATTDDIEVRLCSTSGLCGTGINQMELYVR